MNILIRRGEERYGPYTLEEARRYVGEGRIATDDLASLDEGATWRPLTHLVPELGPAVPAAAPAGATGRYPPGGLGARFGAALLDLLVAGVAVLPGGYLLVETFDSGSTDAGFLWLFAGGIAAILYLLVKDGFGGRSVGKRATGLVVVHLPTDTPCSLGRSAIRTLVFYFSNLVPVVGSLIEPILVVATPDRRRLGDRAASTQVIALRDYRGSASA